MRVFVTGANGFIGSALVQELIGAGHSVVGLARTAEAAEALRRRGAIPHPGALTDLESLRTVASNCDGVIHLAFIHGLSQITLRTRLRVLLGGRPGNIASRFMQVATQADQRALEVFGSCLQGSARPLVSTFGTLGLTSPGKAWPSPATETDAPDPRSPGFGRAQAERIVQTWAHRGVRASIIRLAPTVHGEGNAGFATELVRIARRKGAAAYLGDGRNRWPAVPRTDAARLFRLALEHAPAGACYHGVAEEGIPLRDLAGAIARRLNLPCQALPTEQASSHFGWLAPFVGLDNFTSAQETQAALAWQPSQPGLLAHLVSNDPDSHSTERVAREL